MKHSSALPVARAALRVLIVLNWMYGALILLLLALSFLAEAWTWRALGVGHIAGHEGIVAGMRAIMVIGIASVPLAWIFFSRLLSIVESVRAGEPFRLENGRRLKLIAWVLLALQGLHLLVLAIASAVSTTAQTPLVFLHFHIPPRPERSPSRTPISTSMLSFISWHWPSRNSQAALTWRRYCSRVTLPMQGAVQTLR